MSAAALGWTYGLAPDVTLVAGNATLVLRDPSSELQLGRVDARIVRELLDDGASEAALERRLRGRLTRAAAGERVAALLFALDRRGWLARTVTSRGRRLVSCIPLRPPADPAPTSLPAGPLRLSPRALARFDTAGLVLDVPGGWAMVTVHDRLLLPLVHDLSRPLTASKAIARATGHDGETVAAVLTLLWWAGVLQAKDHEPSPDWAAHDLHFHSRTRRGYTRARLGKAGRAAPARQPQAQRDTAAGRLALEPPSRARLRDDAPFGVVAERRRSIRHQGSAPLTRQQLSEFLHRTLRARHGHRPYPSGGRCYPLRAYVAVHRCLGVEPGLYAYDPERHELTITSGSGPDLEALLAEASSTAGIHEPPQVLLIFAADYPRMRRVYGDLGYRLMLEELGAVFQTALLAATAMGLAACPLGCGDSIRFERISGVSVRDAPSIGELMLGTRGRRR